MAQIVQRHLAARRLDQKTDPGGGSRQDRHLQKVTRRLSAADAAGEAVWLRFPKEPAREGWSFARIRQELEGQGQEELNL